MSVFIVDTYVVKPEKQEEFMALIQRMLKYRKEKPEKFKELKSWKLFSQRFGGIGGAYIGMGEFDNMADAEKYGTRVSKDEAYMKMWQELMLLIVPATYSVNVWNAVM